jgi:phosphate transport system protein
MMGDTRKLIGFGKNSFVVSVPKSWVEKNNLKKGSVLSLSEKGSEILLSSEEYDEKRQLKEIIIECNNSDDKTTKTKIVSAYINDYNTIVLKGIESAKKAKEIRSILHDLVAMEIIEQTTDRIVAKDFLNTQDSSVNTIMRRMDIITRAMISDSILSVDEDHSESVYNRDSDVNRLSHLCFRIIKKGLNDSRIAKRLEMGNTDLLISWLVTQHIETMADNTKRIARCLKYLKAEEKVKSELKNTYKKVQSNYLDILKAYYTKNKDLAYKVLSKHSPTMAKISQLEKDTDKTLNAIMENLRTFQNSVKRIAILIINKEK